MTDSTTITQPDGVLSDERADWLTWRRQREEGLCAPYGWLSQTGLYWLQALGGFRAVIPGINGEWLLQDGEVMFTPQSAGESGKGTDSTGGQSAVLTLVDAKGDRTPIAGPVRVPSDATANGSYVEAGQIRAAVIERGGRFGIRVRDPESQFRRDFTGIPAYDFDPAWRIEGRFEPYGESQDTVVSTRVEWLTSTLEAIGVVRFEAQGVEQRLIAFDGGVKDGARELFVIFRDPTNGDTTYGSGRFLNATVATDTDGTAADEKSDVLLDFNRAFNPPCAFSPYCTCPLAPAENAVTVPVTAGERH